eukprot:2390080-Lingulodinium_polyedra.AAC.1
MVAHQPRRNDPPQPMRLHHAVEQQLIGNCRRAPAAPTANLPDIDQTKKVMPNINPTTKPSRHTTWAATYTTVLHRAMEHPNAGRGFNVAYADTPHL